MGQYFKLVNLDKREYIHPHRLSVGLKLCEQLGDFTGDALLMLLATSCGRGGGDLGNDMPEGVALSVLGRWAGDRVAVVGDYTEVGDLPEIENADHIYAMCSDSADNPYHEGCPHWHSWEKMQVVPADLYTDIGEFVAKAIEHVHNGRITGARQWKSWEPRGVSVGKESGAPAAEEA